MFEKILVPTDFSEKSKYAFEVACSIASKTQSEVLLLHIIEIPLQATKNEFNEYVSLRKEGEMFFNRVLRHTAENLNRFIQETPLARNIKVKPIYQIGDIALDIPELIVQHDVDMLVVGGRTIHRLDEMLEETNREKLIRLARCPVLAVNQRIENFDLKHVVFAVDLKDEEVKTSGKIKGLQKFYGFKITMLHIKTPFDITSEKEILRKGNRLLEIYGYTNAEFRIHKSSSVKRGILEFAETHNADMIAIVIENHNWIYRFFQLQGNLAGNMVNTFPKPVLTFNVSRLKF
ncbi:MAG: universal stress protein [Cytophagales bacterium]|nr:universal stress protein [Cytophagales bacterium]MDW8385302.1 universal stress protein [Flammeovirgaceae bacterium]